jgi:hypothetical protein
MSELEKLRSLLEDLWSCFDCGYLGNQCGHDESENEHDDEACPMCGCHVGDGFGMAENDPRYRDILAIINRETP